MNRRNLLKSILATGAGTSLVVASAKAAAAPRLDYDKTDNILYHLLVTEGELDHDAWENTENIEDPEQWIQAQWQIEYEELEAANNWEPGALNMLSGSWNWNGITWHHQTGRSFSLTAPEVTAYLADAYEITSVEHIHAIVERVESVYPEFQKMRDLANHIIAQKKDQYDAQKKTDDDWRSRGSTLEFYTTQASDSTRKSLNKEVYELLRDDWFDTKA